MAIAPQVGAQRGWWRRSGGAPKVGAAEVVRGDAEPAAREAAELMAHCGSATLGLR